MRMGPTTGGCRSRSSATMLRAELPDREGAEFSTFTRMGQDEFPRAGRGLAFPRFSGDMSKPYDSLCIVGFGGPEKPDDVLPFLENVTRGKPVPRERLLEVAEHYRHFGGV